MHSKMKGSIGELVVATDLLNKGFCVFSELGDLSRIDLIAETSTELLRIQVKAATSKNGKIEVDSFKSGPGYSFKYKEKDVDIFAIYCLDTKQLAYISSRELCNCKSTLTLRIELPKNNQTKGVNLFSNFTWERALRDYTHST